MKPVQKRFLVVLAALVFVYVVAMPVLLGGFGYGTGESSRTTWQTSVHHTHGVSMPVMRDGFGSTGSGALLSGLIQLGVLVLIILGCAWLLGGVSRRDRQPN